MSVLVVALVATAGFARSGTAAAAAPQGKRTVAIAAVGAKGSLRATARGDVIALGTRFRGSPRARGTRLKSPVAGIAAARGGYLVATARGDVFAYGARFRGSPRSRGVRLRSPVAGIAAARGGYLVATARGDVHAFGTRFRGSPRSRGLTLSSRVVGIAAQGRGYMLATADGDVYAFGRRYRGRPRVVRRRLDSPVVGISTAPGRGHLLATAGGTVYGHGRGYGRSHRLRHKGRLAGIATTRNGRWMVATRSGRAFTHIGAGRKLGVAEAACAQPSPPLPPAPAPGLAAARVAGEPLLGLTLAGTAETILHFLVEASATWAVDDGLDDGVGWILNSLSGQSESPQVDPAVIAQQFSDVNAKLDALGTQQYQDCQAVLDQIERVTGTVLQTAYDVQAQPVTNLIAEVQQYQSDFNLIVEKLVENGGVADALPARQKQDMVAMTSGNADGLPGLLKRIDALEQTAVVGASSLIQSYNRVLLHNAGYADDGSDSPYQTHVFPSSFVNAGYRQQNAIAAVVAQAAYLYTNVEHLRFTFDGDRYDPDPDAVEQVVGAAQKSIGSWSAAFSGAWVRQDKPRQGIGMLPDDTVLDYRDQSRPVLWTDGPVTLNGDAAKPTPFYCASRAPYCYANRYAGAGADGPHVVGLTALAAPSAARLPVLIAAQSGDAAATGWQSLKDWRIPTSADWSALQKGATGGLSAWGAANHMRIFESERYGSLAGGAIRPVTTIAPLLVDNGSTASPGYGVLSAVDPGANALTPEPRPFAAGETQNDVAGRLVLARDFTPDDSSPPALARRAAPRLVGAKPDGHRRRRGKRPRRPRLGASPPVRFATPTACAQPGTYTVPAGAGSVQLAVTGGGGAQGARLSAPGREDFQYFAGGRGGVVTQTLPAVAGADLYVQVGGPGSLPGSLTLEGGAGGGGGVGGGGAGGVSVDGVNRDPAGQPPRSGAHSGGGGGASGVATTASCSQWLVVGGGGGGGGAGFINFASSFLNNYDENGGQGGSSCTVDRGPGCDATDARRGAAITYGQLGLAGLAPPGPFGGRLRGGDGGTLRGGGGGGALGGSGQGGGGGGGGGGGYFGGGGGGGAGVLTGGGGGAGGMSFAIAGGSAGTPSYGFGDGTPDAFQRVPPAAGSVTITPIPKAVPPLTVSSSDMDPAWGNPPTLRAKLPADATGIMGFYDDVNGGCDFSGKPGARCVELGLVQITDGVATLLVEARPLGVGAHSIHASYTGDARYAANDSASIPVDVRKGNPALHLRISGTAPPAGRAMASMVALTPPDATGLVTFTLVNQGAPDTVLGSAPIVRQGAAPDVTGAATLQGLAAASRLLKNGANPIRATYAGDADYAAGTSNVVTVTVAAGG